MAEIPKRRRPGKRPPGKKPMQPRPRPAGSGASTPGQSALSEDPPPADIGEKTLIGEQIENEVPSVESARPDSGPQDKATLKIISGGTVSNFKLKKDKVVTSVGSQRDESDIVVNDPAVANKQLSIIYHDGVYVIADCGVHDLATFDGLQTRQVICPIGTRCVINMNNTTLVFESEPAEAPKVGDTRPKKRFHLDMDDFAADAPSAQLVLKVGDRNIRSIGEPIIIGAHRDCDVAVRGEGIRPFHALCYWSVDGINIMKLSSGDIFVNGTAVEKTAQVGSNDEISIGGDEVMKVALSGDVEGRCESLFGGYKLDFNYIRFTAIPGSVCRSFMLPSVGGAVMVGRSPHADVTLEDGAVSREHSQIIPSGKSCQIIDNYSANGCYVNNDKITKARLRAGDLVEIGRSIFFMHYD